MSRVLSVTAAVVLLLDGSAAAAQTTREVTYNPRTVVPIHAKVRFTTLIVLPEQEEILDFVVGTRTSGSSLGSTTWPT